MSAPSGQGPAVAAAGGRVDGSAPRVCVVLHDVAPARWDGCTEVLQHLRAVADAAGVALPVTLLVVPRMHADAAARVRVPPRYLRWLHRLARSGHELALHGLTHRDDGPPPQRWVDRLIRRHYTAGEGEFAALGHDDAAARIAAGRAWAAEHGLATPGFVPPAWLLSPAGWDAIAAAGFDYSCTLGQVVALPERRALRVPSLVFSTRAAWRRALSVAWNTALGWGTRGAPIVRLELHPADAAYPAVRDCWKRWLAAALRERTPIRLHEVAALARHRGTLLQAGG